MIILVNKTAGNVVNLYRPKHDTSEDRQNMKHTIMTISP